MSVREIQCPVCKEIFTSTNNAKKFCSVECRKKASKTRKSQREKTYTCACCGDEFEAERKRRYCCKECRLRANGRLQSTSKRRRKKRNFMSIEEVARASKEMNMTAGEYMRKFCYGKEG